MSESNNVNILLVAMLISFIIIGLGLGLYFTPLYLHHVSTLDVQTTLNYAFLAILGWCLFGFGVVFAIFMWMRK